MNERLATRSGGGEPTDLDGVRGSPLAVDQQHVVWRELELPIGVGDLEDARALLRGYRGLMWGVPRGGYSWGKSMVVVGWAACLVELVLIDNDAGELVRLVFARAEDIVASGEGGHLDPLG